MQKSHRPRRAHLATAASIVLILMIPVWLCGCFRTPGADPIAPGAGDDVVDDTPPVDSGDTTPDESTPPDDAPPVPEALPCISCHSAAMGSRRAVVNDSGVGVHGLTAAPLTNDDCVVCHDVSQHMQGFVRLWSDPNTPASVLVIERDPSRDVGTANQLVNFCRACHSAEAYAFHAVSGAWQPVCTTCHDLHNPGSANLSLVRESVYNVTLGQGMPVVLTARSGSNSFADGTGVVDGVCEVCHTATAHHRYDGSRAAHNDGADCTACHKHARAFLPTGEGSCTECHRRSQGGRRAIVAEFALASHHVRTGSITDADCQVCHDMRRHQQGAVLLKNADDPGHTASSVALTGSPLTDPAEAAKLEPFCLACHDGDGAGGAAPFSDGVMPPVVDATLWASSSHSVGQTTCVGDGETFGCHSTGHGSAKASLLAPWDASESAVAGDPLRQEEGLCYSCHDADGPAATDVQSAFALSVRHNVSADDQADGSRVECTNCHDPHVASAAARLVNPDDGTVWTGGGRDFCLTCHDGAPPAGVQFPPASTGTGFDKTGFVGTTHDTELDADACWQCHEPHGSAHLALLKGRYVVDDDNDYAAGDGDYEACWRCHDESTIMTEQNAFDEYHKKHVREEGAPCIICHNAHGGFDAGEPGLIDLAYSADHGYDLSFVDGADGSTAYALNDTGSKGNCLLKCHGERHDPKSYSR